MKKLLCIVIAWVVFLPMLAQSDDVKESDVKGYEVITDYLDEELENLKSEIIEVFTSNLQFPEDMQFTMNIPVFGKIVFVPLLGKDGKSLGFQALQSKPLELGGLKIEKGLFKIIDNKLSYTARATLLGKSVTLGLKELSLTEQEVKGSPVDSKKLAQEFTEQVQKKKTVDVLQISLEITFDKDAFAVELMPGKKIELKKLELDIDSAKGFSFQHVSEIFGQKVNLVIKVDAKTQELTFEGEFKLYPIVKIIPELKGSVIDGLSWAGKLFFSSKKGLRLSGDVTRSEDDKDAVSIAGIVLKKAHIDINMIKKHVLVRGETTALGLALEAYFALFFGEDNKGAKFAVEIASKIEDWQPFKASTVAAIRDITVNSVKAGIRTQYIAAAKGKKIVDPKSVTSKDEKIVDSDSTAVKGKKIIRPQLKPLNKIIGPQLKPLNKNAEEEELFEDVVARADDVLSGPQGASVSFYIAGRTTILNTVSEVILKIEKNATKPFGAVLIGVLPEGWKVSQSFPEFKSGGSQSPWDVVRDAIELFKIDDARIVASTKADDDVEGESVEPGLNIMAALTLDGTHDNIILKALEKSGVIKTGTKGASFTMQGAFNPADPKNLSLTIKLSTGGFGFTLGSLGRFEGAGFDATVSGTPAVNLGGVFTMIPAPKEDPLQFYFSFKFTPLDFGVSVSMKNIWKNPYGIKGFEFGNLGGEVTQTWTVIAEALATGGLAALVPGTLALTGDLKLGPGSCQDPDRSGLPFCSKITVNIGKDVTNLALVADMTNPINLFSFARLLITQMEGNAELLKAFDKVIPVRIKRGKVYFVPMGTTIGKIKIEQGMGAALYLDIFGGEAHVDGSIGLDGLKLKGKMPAFALGILKMTDFDETCSPNKAINPNSLDTEQMPCGPLVDIQVNAENMHFIIDGLMKFGDIFQSKTKWNVSREGLTFEAHAMVGPAATSFGLTVKGSAFARDGNPFDLLKPLDPKDISLDVEFKNDLTNFLNKNIESFIVGRKAIFEKDLNDAIMVVARRATEQDLKRQADAVEYAKSRRVWFKDNARLSIERETQVKKEELKMLALKAKYNFEKMPLGDFLRNAFEAFGLNRLFEKALQRVRDTGAGAFEAGRFTFNKIAHVAIVKRVTWHGKLVDVTNGILKGAEVEVEFSGKLVTQKIDDFDLKNPVASVALIAKNIATIAVAGIKATLDIPVVVPPFKPVTTPELTAALPAAAVTPAQALLNAAMAGDVSGVINALNAGADKNAKDEYGSTALIIAADRNHVHIVKELLAWGADRNVRNQYGKTAKEYATERGFTEIVSRLG